MRSRSRIFLAALTAALALGAFVSISNANRIAASNQGFRVTWDSSAEHSLDFEGGVGFGEIRCPVTMEGSFHSRTVSKIAELLAGYITRATVGGAGGSCTGGSSRVLTETLPWHMRYDSFIAERGLPFIEGLKLRLVGAAFLVQTGLGTCLFQSTAASPIKGIVNRTTATGVVTSLTPEAAGIPLSRTVAGFCPNPGKMSGSSKTMTVQGGTAAITVTLVA